MHLNDIDREMTNLCRFARSVPIFMEMDADLPSLDQLRIPKDDVMHRDQLTKAVAELHTALVKA
jgi:hypothetical protein